ncbi:hypothetical protein AL036_15875 [Salipiger aestuarii]|uniref:sugar phosphate isomerase/epimerase family protein n=1 Tax=Salipiger aestuarii TaxID=568098 RepID=UPI00123A8D76|nr:sugar phosphate isomerase/epimerase family protein [Salipiger aestuarii]KAA8606148.1 hypothetical protein AL036_15875 [Salipiger aestuarii]
MQMSMSNIAWLPDERLAAYDAMASAGMTGLEIAPGLFFHAAEDPFAPSALVAAAALDEIAAAGLSLVSMQALLFGVTGAAVFEDDTARARLQAGMVRAIDLAGRFGIPNLVFGSPGQRRIPDGMAADEARAIAAALFRDLGDHAHAAGTRIAMEANPAGYGTNFLNTLEQSIDFVGFVDHPAIVPILDLGAMRMNDSFETVPDRVATLGPRLNHVHVSEPQLAPAPAPDTDLAPVLAALKASGYDRAVSIEMKRAPDGLAEVVAAAGRLSAAWQGSLS